MELDAAGLVVRAAAHYSPPQDSTLGMILAIETSCDDTCAAVVTAAGEMRSNIISSQGVHDRYGGVVPEVAARHHLALINDVVDDALRTADVTLDDVELVAVTQGPGLVGALLVGMATAKGLAAARGLPLAAGGPPAGPRGGELPRGVLRAAVPVPDRLRGPHLPGARRGPRRLHGPRAHARRRRRRGLRQGRAHARAALSGRPALERLAAEGDPGAYDFPIAAGVAGLDFSFAGLKTALLYKVRDLGDEARRGGADLAAAYQHAIVEALALRVERGLAQTGLQRLAIGGGVAANGPLRERLAGLGVELHVPERALCTDNAAMIASAARWVTPLRDFGDLDAYASGERGL